MNVAKTILAVTALAVAAPCLAVSKLYNAEAAVILKNGVPCFYIPYAINSDPAVYSDGKGLQLDLFNSSKTNPGYVWRTWFKDRPEKLPVSPEQCITYGTMAKDWKGVQPKPLTTATPYQLEIGGELGKYGAFFCIQKNQRGEKYIAQSDHQGNCSTTPLPVTGTRTK
ncbi:hypothetical protein [Chromobacterium amazonense]|uniref:hypothetical protein n=1 Tax=Chromobacterium amazonense TaxID=1382803 RepID=UPI003F78BFC4